MSGTVTEGLNSCREGGAVRLPCKPGGLGAGRAGLGLTSSRVLVSTLKPWLVSMVCRLSRLESMASRWSLSSVLARGRRAGDVASRYPQVQSCWFLRPAASLPCAGSQEAPRWGPGPSGAGILGHQGGGSGSPITMRPHKASGSMSGWAAKAAGG